MHKNILIVGVGEQGEKYINFFQKESTHISAVCQSKKSEGKISQKYDIPVIIGIGKIKNLQKFDTIIIALPVEIQGDTALKFLEKGYSGKIIIDTPISWDDTTINALKQYENVSFFLEEYYTLFAKLLRQNHHHISDILVRLYIPEDEFDSHESRLVGYIHVHNNFLGILAPYGLTFVPTKADFMRYEIYFQYKNMPCTYKFSHEGVLIIGNKIYNDPINFDLALKQILKEEKNTKLFYSQDF